MTSHPIILAICREHLITPEEFFGNRRTRRLTSARKMAIELLRAKGLSLMGCARLIRRDRETIRYWLYPKVRDQRRTRMKRYMGEVRTPPAEGLAA